MSIEAVLVFQDFFMLFAYMKVNIKWFRTLPRQLLSFHIFHNLTILTCGAVQHLERNMVHLIVKWYNFQVKQILIELYFFADASKSFLVLSDDVDLPLVLIERLGDTCHTVFLELLSTLLLHLYSTETLYLFIYLGKLTFNLSFLRGLERISLIDLTNIAANWRLVEAIQLGQTLLKSLLLLLFGLQGLLALHVFLGLQL